MAAPDPEASRWASQINALGGYIRAQRQLARLSLRELAALTSVSNAYLSQVERGLHQPSLKVLRAIADALTLPAGQLLGQAGWDAPVPEPVCTEDVITGDPRLSVEQRAALLAVYRAFVDG